MEKKMAVDIQLNCTMLEEVKSLQWMNKENEGALCYCTLVNLI